MDDKRITAEELKDAWSLDLDRLAEEVAESLNSAQAGRIIAESEEPVRDANGVFRQRIYERALGLLQEKQRAFSPSGERPFEQRQAGDDASDGHPSNGVLVVEQGLCDPGRHMVGNREPTLQSWCS